MTTVSHGSRLVLAPSPSLRRAVHSTPSYPLHSIGSLSFTSSRALRSVPTCRLSSPESPSIFGDVISDRDKATIATLARRYGAATVWLFGSNADRRTCGRDL